MTMPFYVSPEQAMKDKADYARKGIARGRSGVVIQYDAADDDSATGGPDIARRIFPVVTTITADGFRRLAEAEVAEVVQRVVAERMTSPDGPTAALRG